MSRRNVSLSTNGVIGGWLRTTTGTLVLGRVKPLLLYRRLHSASRMVDQVSMQFSVSTSLLHGSRNGLIRRVYFCASSVHGETDKNTP